MFRGLLIDKQDGQQTASVQMLDQASLPEGEVTVRVAYSTLNYKDALAITGRSPVVRKFPMVAGHRFRRARWKSSARSRFSRPARQGGTQRLGRTGETHWGGLAAAWPACAARFLVPLPAAFTPRQAMAIGTAGYTAMLCVMALERHGVVPQRGEVLVTGASGGVGSVAIALLSRLGFTVVASTGRPQEADYLRELGATTIIDRSELGLPGRALGKERWAGVVDVVGSHTLANACATTLYRGTVAACGLAQGLDFPATVAPFILRGVTLGGHRQCDGAHARPLAGLAAPGR
jgi:acrylyl-CoA reductase (NADPH)